MKKSPYPLLGVLFFLLLTTPYSMHAQLSEHFRIGDTIPDLPLRHLLNHPETTANLSDFRSRLLILDFWDVYCAPCIKNIPKMQALQEAFPDDIRIVLVTKSTEKQVMDLRERSTNVRNCTLPMVIADSVLAPLFSYQTVPAYAWIDADGVLRHFSNASLFLTSSYIKRFLAGERLQMPLKHEYGDFDSRESLLTEGGGRNLDKLAYYSFITHRVPFDGHYGLPLNDPNTGERVGYHLLNHSRAELFLDAYRSLLGVTGLRIRENRLIVNLPDSTDYQPLEQHYLDDEWKNRNLFCYESRLPTGRLDQADELMRRDLALFFGITARIEIREMECLVIKPFDTENLTQRLRSDGEPPRMLWPAKSDSLSLTNMPFFNLLMGIDMLYTGIGQEAPILINDCDIDPLTQINLRIRTADRSLEILGAQLRGFGLDFTRERRPIPMLVLEL